MGSMSTIDEVGLKEKPENTTIHLKRLDRNETQSTGSVGKLNIMLPNFMPSLGAVDLGMGRYVTPRWALGDEIHTSGHHLTHDWWVLGWDEIHTQGHRLTRDWWVLGDEIHTQGHRLTRDWWVLGDEIHTQGHRLTHDWWALGDEIHTQGQHTSVRYGWFWFVGSLTSLCHSNGHIETMPAREINPFTALTRIRSQFLRTQWRAIINEWTRLRLRPLSHRGWREVRMDTTWVSLCGFQTRQKQLILTIWLVYSTFSIGLQY